MFVAAVCLTDAGDAFVGFQFEDGSQGVGRMQPVRTAQWHVSHCDGMDDEIRDPHAECLGLARAAHSSLQSRLAALFGRTLRLGDDEGSRTEILGFVQILFDFGFRLFDSQLDFAPEVVRKL